MPLISESMVLLAKRTNRRKLGKKLGIEKEVGPPELRIIVKRMKTGRMKDLVDHVRRIIMKEVRTSIEMQQKLCKTGDLTCKTVKKRQCIVYCLAIAGVSHFHSE